MEIKEVYILLHTYQNLKREKGEVPFQCILCDGSLAILDKPHGPVLWCPMDDTEQTVGYRLIDAVKEELDAELHR